MMNIHEATDILLETAGDYAIESAREYGGSPRPGDVVAAAYRLAAIKLHEHGSHQHAQDLESAADQAEGAARLERGIPREALLLREVAAPDRPVPSVADRIAEGRRLIAAFNGGRLSALAVAGLVPTLLDQLESLLHSKKFS